MDWFDCVFKELDPVSRQIYLAEVAAPHALGFRDHSDECVFIREVQRSELHLAGRGLVGGNLHSGPLCGALFAFLDFSMVYSEQTKHYGDQNVGVKLCSMQLLLMR